MSHPIPYLESLQVDKDDELYTFLVSPFEWTMQRQIAAQLLADGYTQIETAANIGMDRKSIQRWERHPEFMAEKHKLTLLTGAAVKAERIIMIKQIIRSRLNEDGVLDSKKDVLDWVKLLREEVSALEFAAIMAGILGEHGTE